MQAGEQPEGNTHEVQAYLDGQKASKLFHFLFYEECIGYLISQMKIYITLILMLDLPHWLQGLQHWQPK